MTERFGSFCVLTLGCKVNAYDTQTVREHLSARGLVEVAVPAAADLTVVNTCAVTAEAVRKSRALVRRVRRANPDGRVAVTGCAAAEQPDAFAGMDGVACVAGPAADVLAELDRLGPAPQDVPHIADDDPEDAGAGEPPIGAGMVPLPLAGPESLPQAITRFDGHARAFLKVQDGCDCHCSFCIIPFLRGRVRSKEITAAVAEARALLAAGHREIVLTGVHLGAFGRPHGKPPRRRRSSDGAAATTDGSHPYSSLITQQPSLGWELNRSNRLADLAEALLEIPGRWRLRLSSLEAGEVTDRLIAVMAGSGGRICPHLHLPLQSGSSRVLRRMNRRYSADDFVRTVDAVRRGVPDCAISTDIIVGFPGETDADFEATLAAARRCGFSKIHAFPYSVRPGTAAAGFEGHLPEPVKRDRLRRLTALGDELAEAYHRRYVGAVAEVVLELTESRPGVRTGITERYGEADVAVADGADPGREIVSVRLTGYSDGRFAAERVAQPAGGPPMPKPFLAVVDDLFFRAKIDGAARGLGVPGRFARTADEALSAAVGEPPAVVFVDLNLGSADAVEVIRRAKADPALSATPIIAFVSHVQADLARAGQAAGADEVRPRSWFSENLARVLIDRCGGAPKT